VPMPLLADPATRAPITVADFERAFSQNHPSITYGKQGTTTAIAHVPHGSMQVFVEGLAGETTTVRAEPNDTVEAFKCLLRATKGYPLDLQRIVYAGRNLEDGRTLASYNVTSESTLQLVFRLRGD
jgi:ubiquitin-large subunit ribosomal protein L40e